MLDAKLRPLIDPPLNVLGRRLASLGIGANSITMAGMIVGLGAGVMIAHSYFALGLALILFSRLLDGLDGAVARATKITDFGGYLDIVADFAFYIAVPVGFAFAAPDNMPFALLLVASFTLTGVSFLSFAVLAAKRGLETSDHGQKSFFYNTGLAEGTETIAAFILMCLFPNYFPLIASIFAIICLLTVLQRSLAAFMTFK
ncbi:MAG: CDP-alcohol phosphatidyltransferase family protein [Sphingomonadales bacterium]|nr:CDP-alcohol phosphatidyltransferase family protein [Sphingomonadales bacterium]NCP50271.1 CDP-alcohol phosphatidyltransferase family protein [Sphingomonadales bacterium]NCQ10212.1 CDP-alcohol phosphatidyltransferase family protein [Sphingomonadales bacterium]NCQ47630.1 CDP-alcohol phosphatidyltransferase family protein [Sphingomonadales bacterium]